LFFIFWFPPTIFAQTVFAPAGAKWYYSFPSADTVDFYVLLESEKDTVMHGYDCQKIKRTNYRLYAGPNSSPYYDTTAGPSVYTYVLGDTVFYYHDIFERFVPLYFFNVAVGDTIGFYIPPDTFCYYPSMDSLFYGSVDSVDTVHVTNVPLRRVQQVYGIAMGNPGFAVMGPYMERTGALEDYMLNHVCLNTIPEVSFPVLRCYSDDDIYYSTGSRPCDDLRVSIPGIPSPWSDNIEVYPNPAQSVVYIGNTSCPFDLDVNVYDAIGRLHQTEKCDKGSMCRINVDGVSSGVYWMAIENPAYRFSKKMKLLIGK
jgi:hypothetical protein